MCLITVAQGTDKLKLRHIFHGSHRSTNTQINLLLPRKNNSTISFIRVHKAWQYQNLIEEVFRYKFLSGMSI